MVQLAKVSGVALMFIGLGLLIFTFWMAYILLTEALRIVPWVFGEETITEMFGRVMGPIVRVTVSAVFLGIMGWVGSILVGKGVDAFKKAPVVKKAPPPEEEVIEEEFEELE